MKIYIKFFIIFNISFFIHFGFSNSLKINDLFNLKEVGYYGDLCYKDLNNNILQEIMFYKNGYVQFKDCINNIYLIGDYTCYNNIINIRWETGYISKSINEYIITDKKELKKIIIDGIPFKNCT